MKLKTETGEMLVLDEETQVWKGEEEESTTSITVSEADELLEKGDLEMVADSSEIETAEESLEEAGEPKGKPLKKKKIAVAGSGEVEVHEDDDEDEDDEADGDEADEDDDDEVEETKAKSAKKEEVELEVDVDVEDDVKALFDGQDLTEDFKARTKLVFETAVKAKVKENIASLEEKMQEQLAEQTAAQLADITEKLDGYLDYMISEWIEDNSKAIEHEQKNEILEGFVSGMQKLFADHYIEVPDERYNVVDEQAKEIETLKEQLDAEMNKNVEAKGKLAEASAEKIFREVTEDLTETQKAKMKSLADGVEFEDAETFAEKLNTLKKTYFPSEAEKEEVVAEEGANGTSSEVVMSDAMKKVMASLSQTRETSILGA
tara:strand:- start:13330 stop:14457 length:1128 start_codon:yes stop_codon:yes gene_type:complete